MDRKMMRLTFQRESEKGVVCAGREEGVVFRLNGQRFENRECRMMQDALVFDGYSVWLEGDGTAFESPGAFTLCLSLAPFGYADQADGLFSLFDGARREGLYLQVKKHGAVEAGFGDGREIFVLESLEARLKKGEWNFLGLVFWQEEGWCDLYLNGRLVNRRQFPRHTCVKWPQGKAFLGKRVDGQDCLEGSKTGCFYGLIREVFFARAGMEAFQLRELFKVCPKGAVQDVLDRGVYQGDVQRPVYHLIAPAKWMNEPHAPLYHQGYYHIFYQANPHAPLWNHIQWGHLVSRDMVRWEDMPLALETDELGLDPDGCWSGSAVVDLQGQPRIFYTAGNNRNFPNQSVAMAEGVADGEGKLRFWKKHPVPVAEQKEGWLGEFRDPFVWQEEGQYFMLVGTGDAHNGGGNAILYSSHDCLAWQSHGFFVEYDYEKNLEVGHVWELPVLLPLRDERGSVACHILLLCACQIEGHAVETYGFLGRWDCREKSFRKFHEKAMLLDLGHGTFTGPSGFVTPDGRSVVFTIAQGKRKADEEFGAGWAHNGGLPLELFFKGGQLGLRPIREIGQLRGKKLLEIKDVSLQEANRRLEGIQGNRFCMRICAEGDCLAVETRDHERVWEVSYDRRAQRFGAANERGAQLGIYRGAEDAVDLNGEPIRMDYFLDHSMIEVYLNEKKSMTLRNYIEGEQRSLRLAGTVCRIRCLELWEMETAYREAEHQDMRGRQNGDKHEAEF